MSKFIKILGFLSQNLSKFIKIWFTRSKFIKIRQSLGFKGQTLSKFVLIYLNFGFKDQNLSKFCFFKVKID